MGIVSSLRKEKKTDSTRTAVGSHNEYHRHRRLCHVMLLLLSSNLSKQFIRGNGCNEPFVPRKSRFEYKNERTDSRCTKVHAAQCSGHSADRLTELLEFHQAWCIPSIFCIN